MGGEERGEKEKVDRKVGRGVSVRPCRLKCLCRSDVEYTITIVKKKIIKMIVGKTDL